MKTKVWGGISVSVRHSLKGGRGLKGGKTTGKQPNCRARRQNRGRRRDWLRVGALKSRDSGRRNLERDRKMAIPHWSTRGYSTCDQKKRSGVGDAEDTGPNKICQVKEGKSPDGNLRSRNLGELGNSEKAGWRNAGGKGKRRKSRASATKRAKSLRKRGVRKVKTRKITASNP